MTYELIKPYLEKKLVSEQVHPEDPDVRIFNYTQVCQFSQAWDDITKQCRGLILNIRTGEIIARPFPKFFNYQEHVAKNMPFPDNELPVVFEKLDGSLVILYSLHGKPYIATRGSFTSDQAIWATEWWREHVGILPADNETHLFEIIYPANRIVVSYDYSGLVYLGSINNEKGTTHTSSSWKEPVRRAKEYPIQSLSELAKLDEPNSEGFVCFFPNANLRMKIKHPEYVRLHKLITGVSEIAIWEHLRDGNGLENLLEKVPDEFFQWVTSSVKRLKAEFSAIRDQAQKDFNETLEWAKEEGYTNEGFNRKEIALYMQKKANPGLLFALLDGKSIDLLIWRMVRPHGVKSFKKDIDL